MMPRFASSVTSRMHSHAASYGGVIQSYQNRNILVMDITASHLDPEMAKPGTLAVPCLLRAYSVEHEILDWT